MNLKLTESISAMLNIVTGDFLPIWANLVKNKMLVADTFKGSLFTVCHSAIGISLQSCALNITLKFAFTADIRIPIQQFP